MVTHRSWSFDAYYEETIGTWQIPLLFFLFLTPSRNIPPSPQLGAITHCRRIKTKQNRAQAFHETLFDSPLVKTSPTVGAAACGSDREGAALPKTQD